MGEVMSVVVEEGNSEVNTLVSHEETYEENVEKNAMIGYKLSAGVDKGSLSNMLDMYSEVLSVSEKPKERVSPFTYYKGMYYRRTKIRSCSIADIKRMIKQNDITQAHHLVIEGLNKFTYLNAFMIRCYLNYASKGTITISTVKCRKLLKGMVSKGLLQQYEFMHKDEEGKEQGSAFIYALSSGGLKYSIQANMSVTSKKGEREDVFSITKVLSMLAVNQFHILFESQYEPCGVVAMSSIYKEVYKLANVASDYLIWLPDHSMLNMYVMAVRVVPNWSEEYLQSIRRLDAYMQSRKYKTCFLLVICETEHQAMECERFKCCNGLARVPVFYTTDASIVTYQDVFERLIQVEQEGNYGERTIFRLQIKP